MIKNGIHELEKELGINLKNKELLPEIVCFLIEQRSFLKYHKNINFHNIALTVCLRYGFDGNGFKTLKETGNLTEDSVETIRRRLHKAKRIILGEIKRLGKENFNNFIFINTNKGWLKWAKKERAFISRQ